MPSIFVGYNVILILSTLLSTLIENLMEVEESWVNLKYVHALGVKVVILNTKPLYGFG